MSKRKRKSKKDMDYDVVIREYKEERNKENNRKSNSAHKTVRPNLPDHYDLMVNADGMWMSHTDEVIRYNSVGLTGRMDKEENQRNFRGNKKKRSRKNSGNKNRRKENN